MIYITGDNHRRFGNIRNFCEKMHTTTQDILIILGDVGINYHLNQWDFDLKDDLKQLPITLFCVKGNHEKYAGALAFYEEIEYHKGMAYVEKEYPNLIFAKDGEIYDFDGYRCMVIGGAYSIDKYIRVGRGMPWFDDEQPSEEVKMNVIKKLEKENVDVFLTHTCPLKYEPSEVFLPGFDQQAVDKSTEEFLDQIEERFPYRKWYCGHYHTIKRIDRMQFMFENIEAFHIESCAA